MPFLQGRRAERHGAKRLLRLGLAGRAEPLDAAALKEHIVWFKILVEYKLVLYCIVVCSRISDKLMSYTMKLEYYVMFDDCDYT